MESNLNKLTREEVKQFPAYEEYLSNLNYLDDYDYSNLTYEEVYNLFYDSALILPALHTYVEKDWFNKLTFYRVRLNVDEEKEDISLVQTYSNPPTKFCNENGRANLKYKSVFYCTDDPQCAIMEANVKEGDEGFLSVWRGSAINNLKLGVCLPFDFPNLNDWYSLASNVYKQSKMADENKAVEKHLRLLYRFISNKYITEKKPYPLTSMISNELLFGYDLWRDFIVYPSLKKTKACNMAFHPNSIFKNLNFEKVIRFKIGKFEGEQIRCKLGKTGMLSNNKIIWRERNNEESELFGIKL